MYSKSVVLLVCVSSIMFSACRAAETAPKTGALTRDSAGVFIVESASPAWSSSDAWRVDTSDAQEFGRNEPPERSPLDPVSVFRIRSGEVVVADGNQSGWHALLIFGRDGRWLRTLGRKGEGPCEFQQVWWASPYGSDSLAVFDMARQRVHVLGAQGGCGGSVAVPPTLPGMEPQRGGFVSLAYSVYPDGSLLMAPFGHLTNNSVEGPSRFIQQLIRVDRDGGVRHILGEFEVGASYWDGRWARHVLYGSIADRVLDGYDLIFSTGRSPEIQRYDSTGNLYAVYRRAGELERVTRQDQERAVRQRYVGGGGEGVPGPATERSVGQRIREAHWAETQPFFRSLLLDEGGNIWVEHYRLAALGFEADEEEAAVWSVFDREGIWLGTVTVPAQFFLKSVLDDAVLGVWQDRDGVRTIRSYPLIKPT